MPDGRLTVFLADDNLLVREGVRALLSLADDIEVVGTADDYDSLLREAERLEPNVLVTDIRMPPNFRREGIDAAQQLRKRHPGTGVVVLSQYDDPEYAVFEVADDGAGFDLGESGSGHGFVNTGDRVGAIGGSLNVESAPGRGTRIYGVVPAGGEPGG